MQHGASGWTFSGWNKVVNGKPNQPLAAVHRQLLLTPYSLTLMRE
jgi:hypothetical protein